VLFQQIGELPDEAPALRRSQPTPGALVKRLARGFYCLFNIFAIAFRNLRQNLSSGGIVSWEGFAGNGIDPLPIDQHCARLLDELRHLGMNLR